ncbi:hypothetical protein [Acidovorax carolinensis]|uniref:hypothetical protein n=1 Tax=Acidovorax carolinensis TaxID=553814 RepID=UPI0012FFA919|nr:hypothetical protein [Acidovorax carolinensis]
MDALKKMPADISGNDNGVDVIQGPKPVSMLNAELAPYPADADINDIPAADPNQEGLPIKSGRDFDPSLFIMWTPLRALWPHE